MYNGIGLQTARGSGTNGYVQTNKFFVKPKAPRGPPATDSGSGGDGGGGIRKPNKEILDHDRKRQIEIKLLVLSETLADQGYTEMEIAERVEEKRRELDAAAAAAAEDPEDGEIVAAPFVNRPSETQSHQVAARKEKQMETLKAAFGLLDKSRGRRQEDERPEKDGEKASGSKDLVNQHEKAQDNPRKADLERDKMGHDQKSNGGDKSKERKKYEKIYESSDSGSSGGKTRLDKSHGKAQNEKVKNNTSKAKVDRNEMGHDKKNDGRHKIKERKKYDRNNESSEDGSSAEEARHDRRHGKSVKERRKYDRNNGSSEDESSGDETRHDRRHGKSIKELKKYDRNYERLEDGSRGDETRQDRRHGKSIKERKKNERNYESSEDGSRGDETRQDRRQGKAQYEKVKCNTTKVQVDRNLLGHNKNHNGRDKMKEQKYDRNYGSSDSERSDKTRRERKRHGKAHDVHSNSEAASTIVHKKREEASRRNKKEKRKSYNHSSEYDSESDGIDFKRESGRYAKKSKRHDSDSD